MVLARRGSVEPRYDIPVCARAVLVCDDADDGGLRRHHAEHQSADGLHHGGRVLGVGVYGHVIGNVASLLANTDVARAAHLEKMERA